MTDKTCTGRCYCGEINYQFSGDVIMRAQCHCRECQYPTGGGVNMAMAVAEDGFSYTEGSPNSFSRDDLDAPVIRDFCPTCGTHLVSRAPALPGAVLVKAGTLDNADDYGGPDVAIFTCDSQPYHLVPEGVPAFETVPG